MNTLRNAILTGATVLMVIVYAILLANIVACGTLKNAGALAMSDRWCDAHPTAPSYNCSDHKDTPR